MIRNQEELNAGSPLRPSPRFHSSQAPCFLIPAPNLICTTLKAAGRSGSRSSGGRPFWTDPGSTSGPPVPPSRHPGEVRVSCPPSSPAHRPWDPSGGRPGLREAAGGQLPLPCGGVLAVLTGFDCGSHSGFPWEGAWRRDHPQDASR